LSEHDTMAVRRTSAPRDEFSVAILSFAHVHAEGYADEVAANSSSRIVAVWDEEERRGRDFGERYGAEYIADLDRLLARSDVDGVVCTTPTVMHGDVLVRAAEAGKHIFTEKVLALTVKDCDQILEAVQKAGVELVVSMPRLCDAEMRWAANAIKEGSFGKVTLLRAQVGHPGALDNWFAERKWFGDPRLAGGGALMDLGCHPVYRLLHLGGTVTALTSTMGNLSGSYEVEDNAVVTACFESGATGVIEASWTQRGVPNRLEIYGTKGWALIGFPGAIVQCGGAAFTGNERDVLNVTSLPQRWRSPVEQWVDASIGRRPADIRPEQGRQLTEIMEAAYIASREHQWVNLPLV
jgi:1,5-anhydro-D-fructose reductase (1,5-anhydro-D-mannitol-forming)